jgi:phospholipase C
MPFNDPRIEHLVVLMLENRSFDHMLGFSEIPGIDGLTGTETNPDTNGNPVKVSNDAQYIGDLEPDPGHELFDVNEQIFSTSAVPEHCNYCACTVPSVNVQVFSNPEGMPGLAPPMQGFVKSFYQVSGDAGRACKIMKCFAPNRLQILTTLAREYAVCDRWFSSVPGPTLPNRAFAHAGTTMGEAVSPSGLKLRTIYPILNDPNDPGISAKIYYQDFTMALTFKELMGDQDTYFGMYDDFLTACQDGSKLPSYSFIEPRYYADDTGGAHEPDDQHPDHDVRNAEGLIRDVYEALLSNPDVWQKTVLLIVYDEHGGLYDHVVPPDCVSPDGLVSANPAFDFTRLGVRVPAVIVSPYVTPGTVDHTVYDHTSILATARKLFLPNWTDTFLTQRDKAANTFDGVLTLNQPRSSPLAPHAAAPAAGDPPLGTSIAMGLTLMQKYMVAGAYQAETAYLPPERQTGRLPDEERTRQAGVLCLQGVTTEKEASAYVRDVAQRLRGGQAAARGMAGGQ